MNRYFAENRCPDCGGGLSATSASCPACGLLLVGAVAQELGATLRHADRLLSELRAAEPATVPEAAPVEPRTSRAPRMPAVSVPIVLLGLGGLCLVVAAVVFVAVTWSDLSLGARTAILCGITVLSGAATVATMRRDLRAAAESLGVVTILLMVIDVVAGQATDAPLLGRIPAGQVDWLAGVTLLGGGLGWALAGRRSRIKDLYGVQVLAVTGGLLVCVAIIEDSALDESWTAAALVVPLAAAALAARRVGIDVVAAGAVAGAGVGWLVLAGAGLWHAFEHPTLRELWVDGEGYRLVLAGAFATIAAEWRRPVLPRAVRSGAAFAGLGCGVLVALAPVVDSRLSADAELVVVSVVTAGLAVLGARTSLPWALPARWSTASAGMSVLVSLVPAALVGLVLVVGAERITAGLVWTTSPGAALPPALGAPDLSWALPVAGAALGLGTELIRVSVRRRGYSPLASVAVGATVGAAGAVLLTDWPVLLIGGLLSVAAATAFAASARRSNARLLPGAAMLSAVALAVALTSTGATAVVFAVNAAILVAAGLLVVERHAAPLLAGTGALAGLVSATAIADRAEIDPQATGLLLVGLSGASALLAQWAPAAVRRARAGIESAALLGGAAGLILLDDLSWLAVGLTLAGAVMVAIGLLTSDRARSRWIGAALLAAATWARLIDIDADTVELYTLPSAVVLTVLGARRLMRDGRGSSWTTVLPGMSLGVVPSLLVALDDPTSLRALLVGVVGLGLLGVGVLRRLGAPVVLGVATAALIVFVNVAPHADALPRWVLIGSAGVALVGCGITWEHRMRDITTMRRYLVALH